MLNKVLKKWVRILKLKDWDIQLTESESLDYDGDSYILYDMYNYMQYLKIRRNV